MRAGADKASGRKLRGGARAASASAEGRSLRPRSSECGQSMVEMALLLPLFLMFIFGVIEIGRAWTTRHVITNAAREGARLMVLPYCEPGEPGCPYPYKSADDVRAAARQSVQEYLASAGLDPSAAQITVIEEGSYGGQLVRGQRVGIEITYQFDTPLPAILLSGTSPINMKVGSVMEHE